MQTYIVTLTPFNIKEKETNAWNAHTNTYWKLRRKVEQKANGKCKGQKRERKKGVFNLHERIQEKNERRTKDESKFDTKELAEQSAQEQRKTK